MLPHLCHERPGRMVERNLYQPLHQLVQQDFFKPIQDIFQPLENMFIKTNELASIMNQPVVDEASSDWEKFEVNVDVQHFSPEEIKVKVVNGYIVVEGQHGEKHDDLGFISRQFKRRYALPRGCLPDTVDSKLSSDGVLTVSAPKVLALPSPGERIIPITHTGPVKKIINWNAVE